MAGLVKRVLFIGLLFPLFFANSQDVSQSSFQNVLTVATWNVESGDSDDELIKHQLSNHQDVDIWGLTEVQGVFQSILFEQGAEAGEHSDFQSVLGTTGRADKLQIIFDAERFKLTDSYEIDYINVGGTLRAPLVAHLIDRTTNTEFLFMVNHLARGDENKRFIQAMFLNLWARATTLPVVAVGDFNFDWYVGTDKQEHDAAYDAFVEGDVFDWVKPDMLIRTQCSVSDSGCRYNSILDFVFTSGLAKSWTAESYIYVSPSDFPDDERSSDHRPVFANFVIDRSN